jgi:uncharacterized membrane protein YdbT with pleckstrin-like domain
MDTENKEDFSPAQSLKVIGDMIEKVQNDKLRRLAKKRAGFKMALVISGLVILMLISIWYFTTGPQSYFWPLWPVIVLTVSLVIQYMEAYMGTSFFSEEKEYKKLKAKENK